ncbi:MAG: flippase [Anaerolineales bacterium]|nr:flippase [Anaerolineales bacterium]
MKLSWLRVLPPSLQARLEGRLLLQRLITNTGFLIIDRVIRLSFGLAVGIWLARYLGPEQFGLYNYALAYVSLFGAIASLGLDSIVVRDLVREPAVSAEALGTAFVLKLAASSATVWVMSFALFLLQPTDGALHSIVLIFGFALVLQAFDTIDFWFQAQIKSGSVVIVRNAAFVLMVMVKIGLIYWQAPLEAFVWAYTAEVALSAVGLLIVYQLHRQPLSAWRFRFARAKQMIRDAWPLALSGVAVMIYMRIDQIMLGRWLGNEAVGQYAAATRLVEVWYFIPTTIYSSVLPAIVAGKALGEAEYRKRLQRLFDLMAILAIAITVPTFALAGPLMQLLYGNDYSPSGPILAVLSLSLIFIFFGLAQSTWEVAEGYTQFGLWKRLAGAIVNILLNLWLLPLYGGLGAAIATVFSYAVAASLANVFYRQSWLVLKLQLSALMLVKHLRSSRQPG